jgi:hypothetical protein
MFNSFLNGEKTELKSLQLLSALIRHELQIQKKRSKSNFTGDRSKFNKIYQASYLSIWSILNLFSSFLRHLTRKCLPKKDVIIPLPKVTLS